MKIFRILLIISIDSERSKDHIIRTFNYHFRMLKINEPHIEIINNCNHSLDKIFNINDHEYDLIAINNENKTCFTRHLYKIFKSNKNITKTFKLLIGNSIDSIKIIENNIHTRDYIMQVETNLLQIRPSTFRNRLELRRIIQTFLIDKPKAYISYGNDSQNTARDIIDEFKNYSKIAIPQMHVIEDRTHLKTGMNLVKFMEEIGNGDIVILIINEHYLKSEHAMRELNTVFSNLTEKRLIFPIFVKCKIDFNEFSGFSEVRKHWEDKQKEIDEILENRTAKYSATIILSGRRQLRWPVELIDSG